MTVLENVLWMGGSPCAGKSSLAQMLAETFDLTLYQVDAEFSQHIRRLNRTRQPALTRWLAAPCDERWMQPADRLVQEALACYSEHFELVLADVRALPTDRPVLVEGCALLPNLVAALASPAARGLWIVPTDAFQREHYARRAFIREVLADCADPDAAFRNWMDRDTQFARWVTEAARRCGFPTLVVDGRHTLAESAAEAALAFGLTAGS